MQYIKECRYFGVVLTVGTVEDRAEPGVTMADNVPPLCSVVTGDCGFVSIPGEPGARGHCRVCTPHSYTHRYKGVKVKVNHYENVWV